MTEAVIAGREALARGEWTEALELLGAAAEDPEALEGMGVAHWWLDHADETIATRESAYRLYRERGDALGAARVAGALAWDSILFGGRTDVAHGWLERGHRVLKDEDVTAEHAWLEVREAEVALAAGAPGDGKAAARRAIAIGAEIGFEDVQVVGRSLEGLCLVHEGSIDEGMRGLHESAVAAKGGDLEDVMWVGKVCCNLIGACERVGDVDRATQWCAEAVEFAKRRELRTFFNVCRVQYAAVLVHSGSYTEAEGELERALAVLRGGQRTALHEGTARLGELRRRQGRLDEARTLFAQSVRSRTARLGDVELALDEADMVSAFALAERLERSTERDRPLDRVAVLGVLARAAVAAGRVDVASSAVEELDALARDIGTTGARATAAYAAGDTALAGGDLEFAQRRLEDAVDLFALAEAPYERARTHLSLARVLLALGEEQRAHAEAEAARELFDGLGALHGVVLANAILDPERPTADAESPLTPREHEVLALVAAGRSNREIASELVLSKHTVHRHVANILQKLGEPTRAAAAVRATRDGLV